MPSIVAGTRRLAAGWLIATLVLALAGGCRGVGPTAGAARQAFVRGQLPLAERTLKELAESQPRERHPSRLDLALVEFASGQPKQAESRLRELREHFDSLPAVSPLDDAASLLTDDNARQFTLAAHEQVLLRTLLAMSSLADDGTDAVAYCLQAQAKQAELVRQAGGQAAGPQPPEGRTVQSRPIQSRPIQSQPVQARPVQARPVQARPVQARPGALPFQVALAPYLHGTLREATHQDYDSAERAYRLVSSIQPDFPPVASDIRRAGEGTHSRAGHGVVHVVALVGRGPRLVEVSAPTTEASLQIASTLVRAWHQQQRDDGEAIVLPNVARVKVPAVEIPPSPIAAIGVSTEGRLLGATQTLTDVAGLAQRKSKAEMPWIIGRAVARRVLKESSVVATSEVLGLSGNAAALVEFAAINAWSATERADTRCWGLLPREFQVLRAELPAGRRVIELEPMGAGGGRCGAGRKLEIEVADGRSHYVFVFAPAGIVSVVSQAVAP